MISMLDLLWNTSNKKLLIVDKSYASCNLNQTIFIYDQVTSGVSLYSITLHNNLLLN